MVKIAASVGIIGHGAFGAFCEELITTFSPHLDVKVFSRSKEIDNEHFYSLETVCKTDVVLLCVPIGAYEETLKEIVSLLGDETVLVDVATVKKYTNNLFIEYMQGRHFICAHPMFGPESYKKSGGDVRGYRIAVTDYSLANDDSVALKTLFGLSGFEVIEMSSDEHDRMLAETLFLTHYIGQTMQTAGFGRTPIDTISYMSLMNAVESVVNDKDLFADVYKYNPYCKEVAERFHAAQKEVLDSL